MVSLGQDWGKRLPLLALRGDEVVLGAVVLGELVADVRVDAGEFLRRGNA